MRERLAKLQVQRNALTKRLAATEDIIQQESDMVLSYLDLLEKPGAFYAAADDNVKRKLLAAYFSQIWIDDNGHEVTPLTQPQALVAQIQKATRRGPANVKGTECELGASNSLATNPSFQGAGLSNNTLVPQAGIETATIRLEGESFPRNDEMPVVFVEPTADCMNTDLSGRSCHISPCLRSIQQSVALRGGGLGT